MITIPNNKIVEYANNAIKCFEFFNGHPEINPINNMLKFYVEVRPTNNEQCLAIYNFDNTIILYLYNVLNRILMNNKFKNYNFDDCFYSMMYESIIHELFHSNQKIDMYKYTSNTSYNQEQIEAPVIAKAHSFMSKYVEQMETHFGFHYIEDITLMHRRFKDNDVLINRYMEVDLNTTFVNMLTSICLKNRKDYRELLMISDQPNLEVYITIDNGVALNNVYPIKSNSSYNQFALNLLYSDLNKYKSLFLGETDLNIMTVNNVVRIIIMVYTDNIRKTIPFVMVPNK